MKNANLLLCGALIAKDLREKCRLLKKMHPLFWPVDTFYLIIICILHPFQNSLDIQILNFLHVLIPGLFGHFEENQAEITQFS